MSIGRTTGSGTETGNNSEDTAGEQWIIEPYAHAFIHPVNIAYNCHATKKPPFEFPQGAALAFERKTTSRGRELPGVSENYLV